ncbi:MAG: hypothetical protein GTN65_14575 [Armatimonadetes bacterium]|nr:hypothetical protein [Armatimonadota bacterium]NIO98286.1 hypothetical protein [Armatimonadota bacterium]
MANQAFVDSLLEEIIRPGVEELMESRYFSELSEGKLSIRRLQGFALKHYLHNIALCKGFSLCMVKYAHDLELFKHFAHQLSEQQGHPALAKRYGLAPSLKEEDFLNVMPIYECLAHTSAVIRAMYLGLPAENRA